MKVETAIPLVDLRAQYGRYREEIDGAIQRVIDAGAFIGGPELAAFETEFASYCGVKHAVGLANGTVALVVALKALGIGVGDEVIVPSHTFAATGSSVRLVGATPVFVDVEPVHFTIDPAAVRAALTRATRAVIGVDIYGNPACWTELEGLARESGLHLVEDAAQAHGAAIGERRAGAFGAVATFSFYPGKNLGAYGDAGCITTNDDALASFCRRYRNHGRKDKYLHDSIGTNYRMDGMQAAILRAKLRHLEEWNARRGELAQRYAAGLAGIAGIELPHVKKGDERFRQVVHIYPVFVMDGRRDAMLDHLRDRGIEAGVHYPVPLHLQPCFEDLPRRSLPVSERIGATELSLPLCPELRTADQDRIITAVRDFFER